MARIRYLVSRSVSLYQNLGLTGLLSSIKKYVRHGSLRDDLIRIVPANRQIIHTHIKLRNKVSPNKYTDANPFKILWVKPSQIKYCVSESQLPAKFGRVYGGSWDLTNKKFVSKITYKSLEKHFSEGVPWEKTRYYKNKYNKLKKGKPTRGCSSVEDLPEYFAEIDKLYSDIVKEGYQTQQTLKSKNPDETIRKNLDAPTASMNEIGVSIGRNGKLIKHLRGRHRLSIAKIADIDKIPVQVLVRHKEWQSVRNKIKNTNADIGSVSYPDHPDLDDIL